MKPANPRTRGAAAVAGIALALITLAAFAQAAVGSDGSWVQIATGEAPVGSTEYTVAYDSARNRLLAYFGYPNTDSRLQDVWALSLSGPANWTRIHSTGTVPTTGYRCSSIYDPVGDRMILYGGTFAQAGSDLYQLSLGGVPTWSPIAAIGGIPQARAANGAIYDEVGHRMVIYGGLGQADYLSDVWALSLDGTPTWTPLLAGGGPGKRAWSQTIYDAANRRMIVHGGIYDAVHADAWALSLVGAPVWTALSLSGGPNRFAGAAVYDPSNHRLLVYGGAGVGSLFQEGLYALSLAPGGGWTQLSSGSGPGPGKRAYLGGVYDAMQSRFVIFAGNEGTPANDVWAVPASITPAWSQVRPDAAALDERSDASMVYDPLRHRALLYGGSRGSGVTEEVWTLNPGESEWRLLATAADGTPKRSRAGASAVWDAGRDRMVVYGGVDGNAVLQLDVVALSGAGTPTWSAVAALSPPLGRKYAAGAYDPVRDRVLYFAGYPVQNARNQLWSLSLVGSNGTWAQLSPTGTGPNQRWGHTMTYDPVRDRMLVFGGGDGGVSNGLWALSLAGAGAWTALAGPGTPPPARTFHSAIYDPSGDRLLVWGGRGAFGVYLSDTWEYRFNGQGWRQLSPGQSPAPQAAASVYDPWLNRMVIFGGSGPSGARRDTWVLDLAGQATGITDGPLPPRFTLDGATPNPSYRAPRIALSLPDGVAASLELLDIAGRRVRVRNVGVLGAGRHVVDLGVEGGIAPGLYFARLRRAGETLTTKVCIAR